MSRELEDKQEGEQDEDRGELIKCYGHIAGKRVVVLFDTGSTEDVISSSLVESARLKKSPMTALSASGFSAGMDTSFTEECKDVKLVIQQVEFKRDFLVAKLVACDIILGMKWFHKFQPVVNWSRHTLSIHDNVSQPVMIRGEAGIPSLPLISHIQAKRELRRGTQAAIIYVNPKAKDLGIPQRYGELFNRFNDLFLQHDLPSALPPERPEDHVIDLVDGAELVSKFPYRLNKVHEEELERQLGELLDRGFIRPSISPFAAPILFLRKNYSIYDKALLAMIHVLKHWKHFLYGRDFTVRTDHQALRWLQSMPSANWSDRQARWSQYFEQFGGMSIFSESLIQSQML